jgi:signal transduction histidine kinase
MLMNDEKAARARARMELGTSSQKSRAKIGRDIQAKIGQQLRAMYDDVVNQGVPDRFADLLQRLDLPKNDKPDDNKAPQ